MNELQDALDRLEVFDRRNGLTFQLVMDLGVAVEAARRVANPDIEAVAGYLYGSHDHKAMKKARLIVSLALGITTDTDGN